MSEYEKHTDLARVWIDTWNTRDLEKILVLYSEDAQMSSAAVSRLGLSEDGQVAGKDSLRKYWSLGLSKKPKLHFRLLDVFASPDSIVVRYLDEREQTICEYLRINSEGKIIQGSANPLIE